MRSRVCKPRGSALSLALALIVMAAGIPAVATASSGGITRVSVAYNGAQGDGASGGPSVSQNGRFVAFQSEANNLVPDDTNGVSDIFVRDTVSGETTRVSVSSEEVQGNGSSEKPCISADGYHVGFQSYASNLDVGDTNGREDVFVRDLVSGQTRRVSVTSAAEGGNQHSGNVSLSHIGRYVAFTSASTNLVGDDTNGHEDVFWRDRFSGTTTRVSLANDGSEANDENFWPSISADGRYVAFSSWASNLTTGDVNAEEDVFVRDTTANTTTLISVSTSGTQGNDGSSYPHVSPDGRYVAFSSGANNLVANDTNNAGDIFVRDTLSNTTTRVSVANDGSQGNDACGDRPRISGDGRYVAFDSWSSNLVPGDTLADREVFVRDTVGGTTTRLSVGLGGAEQNALSLSPWISEDGSCTAFQSSASNLVAGDTNDKDDVFVSGLSAGGGGECSRTAGADRYETAAAVASVFATGSASDVVLACGGNFPDALSAAGLAGAVRGPLVLTRYGEVPASTLAQIARVTSGETTRTVRIVGGTSVVSTAVENSLKSAGYTVLRHAGADRYATAAAVASAIRAITGSTPSAFVVRGDSFADALAVGPLAYRQATPVLLTRPTELPSSTSNAITGLGITTVVIAGGTPAVSAGVASAIDALPGVGTPVRKSGTDRYATASAVAGYGLEQAWTGVGWTGVATGVNYPDALSAGPACGEMGGVLLLTYPTTLSTPTSSFITAHKSEIATVTVYGSNAAISDSVVTAIGALLQ